LTVVKQFKAEKMSAIQRTGNSGSIQDLMADGLTEEEAMELLGESAPLAKSQSKAVATGRKPVQTQQAEHGLTKLGRQAQAEVDAIEGALQAGADQFVETTAAKLCDVVSNTPGRVLSRVAEIAEESQADPETFRSAGDRVSQAIFGAH
jgi:hypothetical protein